MRPLIFRSRRIRRRLVFPLVVSMIICAFGTWMVRHPHAPHDMQRGGAIAAAFGLVLLILLRLVLQRALTIDARGVSDVDLGLGLVPWHDIVDAEVLAIPTAEGGAVHFLRLRVQNFQMYRDRAPTHFHRHAIDIVQAPGAPFGALQLNISDLGADPQALAGMINATALQHRSGRAPSP